MAKNRHLIILVCFMLLSCLDKKPAIAEDYTKNVEVVESRIIFSRTKFPSIAYLSMELKNKGNKNIANLNLEIRYYNAEGCQIKKVVLKNKLTESIPPGESRKFKIHLNGDVFNERNEEYPYLRGDEVDGFDVKILNIKFGKK